ncbi:MAG: shikimate kinase [Lachnospiraceae bacterium]
MIGFYAGSGKSIIAAELSRMLHRPVLEMDEEIENGKVCPSLLSFLEHGEAYFRQLETDLRKKSLPGGFLASRGGSRHAEENAREMKAASSSCSLLFRKPS